MDRSEGRSTGDQSGACGRGNGATNYPHATAETQRRRLHAYLRVHGNISTVEARAKLAIMAPAARIWELRHDEGHPIRTERDRYGIATYHLAGGGTDANP
jgi:hypothetical protein